MAGGALVNARGEVVGMPTLLFREGQNLNFAISALVLNDSLKTARDNNPAIEARNAQRGISDEEWSQLWNGGIDFSNDVLPHNFDLWDIYNDFPMY